MKAKWNNVTAKHVKAAIKLFDKSNDDYPKSRNTFLIFNKKEYPAKHIRGLAYFIANKKEILKGEYSGGQETVTFFTKLGFNVRYDKKTSKPKKTKPTLKTTKKKTNSILSVITKKTESIVKTISKKITVKKKKLSVVAQKNALQVLLQKHCGIIEIEKKFDWLKTPNQSQLPREYKDIVKSLYAYRKQGKFRRSNYKLPCDIVLEEFRLIIEYDENQHFTKSRLITLENYPPSIKLNFSKKDWIDSCKTINAKDNNPIDRDEKRAFYDTVRDIEAYKNGYKLVRIKHGDIDWKEKGTEKHLLKLLPNKRKISSKKIQEHKIARLIVTEKDYPNNRDNYKKLENVIKRFLKKTYGKRRFEFILTPGGFLHFNFRVNSNKSLEEIERTKISFLQKEANKIIITFFNSLEKSTFQQLKEVADYFTIGIDGQDTNHGSTRHVELVAIYDLKKEKVIKWTGKFYPNDSQKRDLIKINNLKSHFIQLNNQNILVLGCHDLSVYNPRGQANANLNGWKKKLANRFKKLIREFEPDIIMQHPHTTDTPNIWNTSWKALERDLPTVKHFASGINYSNTNEYGGYEKNRGTLEKVLEKTKKGDVLDFS